MHFTLDCNAFIIFITKALRITLCRISFLVCIFRTKKNVKTNGNECPTTMCACHNKRLNMNMNLDVVMTNSKSAGEDSTIARCEKKLASKQMKQPSRINKHTQEHDIVSDEVNSVRAVCTIHTYV